MEVVSYVVRGLFQSHLEAVDVMLSRTRIRTGVQHPWIVS